ncbi:substrate-binding periplasmic protein [Bifidobacterium aquikefiri]|uniref:Amino acid ABC transporter substrate-binding protein n=1 Tax=Bifidobacterium aquikefiri TaxID=1653207 RepID=A0A261G8Z1_9BIFI|nr:transporter substrate-binding domain-containing protein [Bifidobacterium aquikefiri]OZG67888.1 amino acid ABC transporter substrate-binding protein [Bifidobacterium aquikefiri]
MASNRKVKATNRMVTEIIIVIVISLVCGFSAAKLAGGGASQASSSDSSQGSWIARVKKAGVLKVGMAEAAPTLSKNSKGQWEGPWTIPSETIAKALGVKVQYVTTSWGNIVAGLQSGDYDLAAGLDITLARSLAVGFTAPMTGTNNVLMVPKNTTAKTEDALLTNAKPIAVPQGSAQESSLKLKDKNVLSVDSFPDAIQAVNSGRACAVLLPADTAVQAAQNNDSLAILVPQNPIAVAISGFGVSHSIDSSSLATLNAAITDAVNSGQIQASFEKVKIDTTITNGYVEASVPAKYQLS